MIIQYLWHEAFKWTVACEVFSVRSSYVKYFWQKFHMNLFWSFLGDVKVSCEVQPFLCLWTFDFLLAFCVPIWAYFGQESLKASLAHVTCPHKWSDEVSMSTKYKTFQGKDIYDEKYGVHITKWKCCVEKGDMVYQFVDFRQNMV